ncbi:hypothetical protein BGZ94_008841, partial [Podila epigama]
MTSIADSNTQHRHSIGGNAETGFGSGRRSSMGNTRNSFSESTLLMQSGRSSLGQHRTSLVSSSSKPTGQTSQLQHSGVSTAPTLPQLPVPQLDSEEFFARVQTFTSELDSGIQKCKARITESTDKWVQETGELQSSDRALRADLKIAQVQEQALDK